MSSLPEPSAIRIAAMVIMLLGLLSCDGSPSPAVLPADTFPQAPLVTPEVCALAVESFPLDLFATRHDLIYGSLAEAPQDLPLDGWESNVPLRFDGALHGEKAPPTVPRIERSVAVNPMHYTHLELTVAMEAGDRLSIWWDTPSTDDRPPHASALILADNQPHTYLVPLEYGEHMPWRRPIDHLMLAPSNEVSAFTLHAARFRAIAPDHPLRLTLDRVTMPSSRLTNFDLDLPPLPEGATFSVALGSPGNAVKFQIAHEQAGQQEVLLEKVVNQAVWELVSVQIPPVTTSSTLSLRQTSGYWGAPLLDVPHSQAGAVPVILISNDTLRADHLGCYGYDRDTSPVLDAFAKDAVLFEEAFTPESFTLTAHMSMLTGLYPKHHGLTQNLNLREEAFTLPEVLRARDYFTGCFVGMEWWFTAWRGYAQGFHAHSVPDVYRSVFDTYGLARNWLDHLPGDRFFLFLHNYDLHSKMDNGLPYDANDDRFRKFSSTVQDPPSFPEVESGKIGATLYLGGNNSSGSALSEAQHAYMRALYDDCILKVDFANGELFDYLKERGIYDRALIVVTSDHGEAFGEKGRYLHGDVYEHNIHVPLLIKFPNQKFAGTRVKGLVELSDIYPTVLEVLGISPPEKLDGKSLLPLIQGEPSNRDEVYATRGAWRAVRTKTDKVVRELVKDTTEYYDLAADPRESMNQAEANPERVAALRAAIETFYAPAAGGWQIALSTGSETWDLTFTVSSTGVLDTVRLARTRAVERIDRISASQWVEGQIALTPQVGQDTLIVKPTQGHEEIRLMLESELPFSVRMGDVTLDPATGFDQILSPTDPRLQAPPAGDPATYPTVAIWYEAPEVSGTAAQELSPEDIEALKALGYLEE